jgi:hypothetical protein
MEEPPADAAPPGDAVEDISPQIKEVPLVDDPAVGPTRPHIALKSSIPSTLWTESWNTTLSP